MGKGLDPTLSPSCTAWGKLDVGTAVAVLGCQQCLAAAQHACSHN